MDLAATLPPELIVLLSDSTRSLGSSETLFQAQRRGLSNIQPGKRDNAWQAAGLEEFAAAVMLRNELDRMESGESVSGAPCSHAQLALALNCEYLIYRLYASTPVRVHPFLSHWVETLGRLDEVTGSDTGQAASGIDHGGDSRPRSVGIPITWSQLHHTRCALIMAILTLDPPNDDANSATDSPPLLLSPSELSAQTPLDLVSHFATTRRPLHPFSIRPFVHILVEEGVYDSTVLENASKPPPPPTTTTDRNHRGGANKAAFARTLLTRLEALPHETVPILTHLPIDLASLDFLTNLLQNGTLVALGIEPAPVIRDYIQHSLRLLERVNTPGVEVGGFGLITSGSSQGSNNEADGGYTYDTGPAISPNSATTGPTSGSSSYSPSTLPSSSSFQRPISASTSGSTTLRNLESAPPPPLPPYLVDRAGQTRAVKLLVLFLSNLVRKALLPPEEVYFEIQEICIRFIWVKEVREFRAFLEGEGD